MANRGQFAVFGELVRGVHSRRVASGESSVDAALSIQREAALYANFAKEYQNLIN